MRWFTPVFFIAATVFVGWYNQNHKDSVLLLPGVDLLAPGDMQRQGELSVWITGGLAVLFTLSALRRRQPEE